MLKPRNSETTGRPNPASAPASGTGTQLSVTGSARPPSTPEEVRELLAELTPDQIDKSLQAWLPPSVSCRIEGRLYDGPNDPYKNYTTVGYDLAEGWDENEGREAQRLLEMLNARADPEACQQILARLKVLTRERNLSQEDMVAQIAIFSEELSQYPLDVVRDACRAWARTEKWFPSWAELRERCEERVMKRRAILLGLKRYFDGRVV